MTHAWISSAVIPGRDEVASPEMTAKPSYVDFCPIFAAISASFATVFMLRAVPAFAAGIRNFDRP
jgi:hypothetical protein